MLCLCLALMNLWLSVAPPSSSSFVTMVVSIPLWVVKWDRVSADEEPSPWSHFRTSVVTARSYKAPTHGRNTTTKQKTHSGVRQGRNIFTSIWDRWPNDKTHRESQLAIHWSDAWVRSLDTLHKFISLIKRHKNKEVDTTIYFISEVLTKIE